MCLNDQNFEHKFANIHLSGPCNRRCYFCIGQHMMALDALNTLNQWPLPGIEDFVTACVEQGVTEVNLTGSNTDPTLYQHLPELTTYLRTHIPGVRLGIRTNAVKKDFPHWNLFDKGSVSFCSTNPETYRAMMGCGDPPDIPQLLRDTASWENLKINIILGPENTGENYMDLVTTLADLSDMGVRKVNLREPYGQPHVGNPYGAVMPQGTHFGMPLYHLSEMEITYWDVHYVEVDSLNLYASGRMDSHYSVSQGHADTGEVHDQSYWSKAGRHVKQWTSF